MPTNTVAVTTEEDAYIELAEPNVVLDGPVFGVYPIPLTKSGDIVTCRCYEVATDGAINETYDIYLPMIVR